MAEYCVNMKAPGGAGICGLKVQRIFESEDDQSAIRQAEKIADGMVCTPLQLGKKTSETSGEIVHTWPEAK